MSQPIRPGSALGLLGGGQLGRMFTLAARNLGYRVHALDPGQDCPAGQVADLEIRAAYNDVYAAQALARGVDVVTVEFENIPAETLEAVAEVRPMHPGAFVLHTVQHRLREKRFLAEHGFPVTPFRQIDTEQDLREAAAALGLPAVLKTASFGYDGKGQQKLTAPEQVPVAFAALGGQQGILEAWVPFELECSVVCARSSTGETAVWEVAENAHRNHILDTTVFPARIPAEVAKRAQAMAIAIAESLGVVGMLTVEFFLKAGGELLVNELAPRPHNSGHATIDACTTSQFEQQVRAVCGLPLGDTTLLRPAAMANLLGDLWPRGGEPAWERLLDHRDVKLHLYGKTEARPGRKMGHLTALADTPEAALAKVVAAREALKG
ncbi:N5-carboxyaminoimidazole ribonucleotide synthase [Geothrix rubra]|uniref:N5-carboxyaminoimidazole ribonucleotide synthase n=1 Tax=Geothrix rubra TaxID=2927977 RepID=A0ABQ5Q2L2_9BACT|nr:5-(carboxyamino)imidazole ribonucleotide synthase [Geothrix rubra]GLH68837.1 N5-carboxyaminoimidazole ribonucleotide synthase [Geothrix rubra]